MDKIDSSLPLCVIMITFNEAHNLPKVFNNLAGFAREVCVVDSFSSDETVDICLSYGAKVVQRPFDGFGSQWNFALEYFKSSCPWTMKIDPDEIVSKQLKESIEKAILNDACDSISFNRRLYFMGKKLTVSDRILRVWKTGTVRFSDVLVNEHPLSNGVDLVVNGELEHHDSPDLHHWFEKQNRYSSAEALARYRNESLSANPRLFGGPLERRMFFKRLLTILPFTGIAVFVYYFVFRGMFSVGKVGYIWSGLRAHVYHVRRLKYYEMVLTKKELSIPRNLIGSPHPQVKQIGSLR